MPFNGLLFSIYDHFSLIAVAALDKIRIVLVRAFHAGNIGSVARSMKTMGLSDLCLVNPRDFPSAEATKMAAGAYHMLDQVRVFDSLNAAIADCRIVIACTARPRGYDLPELSPQEAAEMCLGEATDSSAAVIFGPERMGLHNEDIQQAKYRLTIPASADYNSLNLAAAVQIVSYEIFKAWSSELPDPLQPSRELPSTGEMQQFYEHLEQVLTEINFLRPHRGETLQRLRHLIARAEPDVQENNILRGILSAIQKSRR